MFNSLAHTRLTATCHGIASDDACPESKGTRFSLPVEIGHFGQLDDAMHASMCYVAEQRYEQQRDPEHFIAMATHVDIRDEQGALVLRGIVLGALVDWCPPVRSRKEVRNIRQQVDRLSEEYVHQDFLVERETAKRLGIDHVERIAEHITVLEGGLVAPAWRDKASWAVKKHLRQVAIAHPEKAF
ncbi:MULTISPECIES: hypothetical protein [unclassified Brenneria]|uniref:hypothetical protein n=1 Tax=unclassified Brenneria TaxID=2634434 RepID=UPI0018F05E73|nr:hypothetical protein [Brenneria sp. L3-3C-1]MBJ7223555.1 hypothetical protein [Brenneria sp. L3-3C-1]MEE3644797.1 hypothetical protein [Brenneria sp. L3_3C_1]